MAGMRARRLWVASVLAAAAAGAAQAGLGDLFKSAEDLMRSAPSGATTALGSGLSNAEIGGGLKDALSVGAARAIALLGKPGGYLNDPKVRIPLPGALATVGKGLRTLGYGGLVDEFENTVNRAAEQAIPETQDIVEKTVTEMTLEDVRGILNGGDDAATQFLRRKAGGDLHQAILPIVSEATDRAGATAAYKDLTRQADSSLGGLVSTQSVDLDNYVTEKALDGLFAKLADEERQIRENPAARSTELLQKVFGGG
jgi:hypothetical protein